MSMTATSTTPASGDVDRDSVIRCVGLTKVFRDFWHRPRVRAVDGIDLDVKRGQIFGLLGPNGSGKSTTIKMILGLLHPTAGRVAVFGRHPRDVASKQDIGYLPEESYLYRFLNARETLEYYGRLFHQGGAQRRHRIDTLLEMVGLDKVATRPVGEYSKGMQRRIGLAQALINDPQLLILDEPTTGMDPIGTRQIKDLLRELARRGKTILLCSHLLADVEDVCDQVSIMFGGKVRQAGTVDELLVREGVTTVSAAGLDEADVEAIERLLESRGKHIERVEQPRQKLETLFLNIVHAAQQEGVATSGAGSGGPVAEFLTAGGAEGGESERVIESLTKRGERRDGEVGEGPGRVPPAEAAEPAPDEGGQAQVIEGLLGEAREAEAEPPRAPEAQASSSQPGVEPEVAGASAEQDEPSEEEVDDSLLQSLMGEQREEEDEDEAEGRERRG